MKGLIWIVVLFAIAAGVAIAAQSYSGNVHIIIDQLKTDYIVSLHLFIGAVLVLMVVIYLLIRLLAGLIAIPSSVRRFGNHRGGRKAAAALNRAGLAFFEGKYQQAEREAAKVLESKHGDEHQTLALMLAAHSANHAGDVDKRRDYLAQLAKLPAKRQLTRHLLLAEDALNRRDYPLAEQELQAASAINPNLTQLVRLQLRYWYDRRAPMEVLNRVSKLEKAGALTEEEALFYQDWAYRELLVLAADYPALKACLSRIPKALKEGELNVQIAEKFVAIGEYARAVKWVRQYYPQNHQAALLPPMITAGQYLSEKEQQKVMDTAEEWLRISPQDGALLLNLGQMAYTKQLWGKAQNYLEASINLQPSNQARLLLAKVFDQMGKSQQAEAQRQLVLVDMAPDEDDISPAPLPASN